eukprot:TRINITY_DN14421_c0_g2_i1.p1 TRINITY_DN14421_c0_g2~~TRINITY_DN14421_c0_g2_i1.p1  ORF type:complete len:363 (+),score=81.89 TRINITY_DN14421_c0_g2_i1:153-1241(+)
MEQQEVAILPPPPRLARILASAADVSGVAPESAALLACAGDIVNVVNEMPDGKLVYCVACDADGGLREGLLPAECVQELSDGETQAVPPERKLDGARLVQRQSFACVVEPWRDPEEDEATLVVNEGDLLQLVTIREGWAYGVVLQSTERRGWFPARLLELLPSSLSSLVRKRPGVESGSAWDALVDLMRSAEAFPPALEPAWGDAPLPGVVADSERQMKLEFDERFAAVTATGEEEQDGLDEAVEEGASAAAQDTGLFNNVPPDDLLPLVVCKCAFRPAAGAHEPKASLQLQVGDLVRVTTPLGLKSPFLHGFLNGNSTARGWFPNRCVKLLEDPLRSEPLPPLVHQDPLPLPDVPRFLFAR